MPQVDFYISRQICEDTETGIRTGVSLDIRDIEGQEPVAFLDGLAVFDIESKSLSIQGIRPDTGLQHIFQSVFRVHANGIFFFKNKKTQTRHKVRTELAPTGR